MLEKINAEDVVVGDMIRSATLTDPDIPLRYEIKPVVRIERTPNNVDGGEFISLYFENGNVLPVSTGRELTVDRRTEHENTFDRISRAHDGIRTIAAMMRDGAEPPKFITLPLNITDGEDYARRAMRLDIVVDMSASMATDQPTARRDGGAADRVTGYVVVDADGARAVSADRLVKDMEAAHYGADVDPREVVFVHLRGEYGLHRVVFTSGGEAHTDDRDYVHHTTVARLADGPNVGMAVGELHTVVDGRA